MSTTKEEQVMLQIDDTLISLDILEKLFCCDLSQCKGACCVHGDSGAPLTDEELNIIPEILNDVRPYLSKESNRIIADKGWYFTDVEADNVTMLINGKECVFAYFDEGIAKCSIEKAFFDKKIEFRKPISCHLYPVRVKQYKEFKAVNYDKWDICKSARIAGEKHGTPIYIFLKDAFIRKFGEKWYEQLVYSAENIDKLKG